LYGNNVVHSWSRWRVLPKRRRKRAEDKRRERVCHHHWPLFVSVTASNVATRNVILSEICCVPSGGFDRHRGRVSHGRLDSLLTGRDSHLVLEPHREVVHRCFRSARQSGVHPQTHPAEIQLVGVVSREW